MAEMSLNDPLSGEEIKKILLQRIKDQLDRDCTLQNDLSYPSFSMIFEINIKYARAAVPSTLVWGKVDGELEKPSDQALEEVAENVKASYESGPPNVARQEHDLPIPVMVSTPSGPQRRKVHFERAQAAPKEVSK